MMKDFVYYNPVKIYFGVSQINNNLANEVRQLGSRVLLVYGGESIKNCGIYNLIISLLADFEIFELKGVEPNPDIKSIRMGAEICKNKKIEVILAVGGGSVIDAAKWIAASGCVDFDAWDFFSRKTEITDSLPVVTVSTIAATGSDMNNGGVISNRDEEKKIGRSSEFLYPKVSFLNPEFTFSVGKYQTACGIVDIISHVMEVFFTRQESFELLDNIMGSILRTVIKYGKMAFNEPDNYEARANIMWAASWAINGFISGPIKQPWNCHIIEHELSARYNIAHGHGLAILLPRWLDYCYSREVHTRYNTFSQNVFGVDFEFGKTGNISKKISELFFEYFNLSSRLRDLNIPRCDLAKIAHTVCLNGPINGFVTLEEDDVYSILCKSF